MSDTGAVERQARTRVGGANDDRLRSDDRIRIALEGTATRAARRGRPAASCGYDVGQFPRQPAGNARIRLPLCKQAGATQIIANGAIALGTGLTVLGILIAGLSYALLGLITPEVASGLVCTPLRRNNTSRNPGRMAGGFW